MSNQIVFEKQCGNCKDIKHFSFFSSNQCGKYNLSSRCKQCDNLYYQKNKEKIKEKAKNWRSNNRQRSLESKKNHYQKNSDSYKLRARSWELQNKDKHEELAYFYCAKRRSSKKTATPPWADINSIKEIYAQALRMKNSGLDVEVDHVIPLVHNLVCGLHVAENLKIISKQDNRKKHNKFLIEEI